MLLKVCDVGLGQSIALPSRKKHEDPLEIIMYEETNDPQEIRREVMYACMYMQL